MNDRTPTEATWLLKQGATPEQALERIAQRIAVWRDADPDEDESWESFYEAAFDMLSAEVDDIISAASKPIAASPPAPAAEPVAGLVLRLSVHRMMGMYGAAYDGPKDARAYTFKHQPSNQPAWKMGKAACAAAKEPGGDYIDGGLALLRHLEAEGFGVFALVKDEPLEPHPIDAAAIRAEARREALEALAWALDEIDALSNKLNGFAYPQGMALANREAQAAAYTRAVEMRGAGAHKGEAEGWRPLDPDMPAQEMRLHMGEMTAQEMRAARAAIRWANSRLPAPPAGGRDGE